MDQIQRDLTYRLDALLQICDRYGYESDICQQSIQIWKSQHSANMLFANHERYTSWMSSVEIILIFVILGTILYFWFPKLKSQKIKNNGSDEVK